MKMSLKVTKVITVILCFSMVLGSTLTANAAQKSLKASAYQAVFDADYYYNTYPDLQAAFGYDPNRLFDHFISSGIYEGRSGCANFNLSIYMANNPDLLAAFGANCIAYLDHYVQIGYSEGRITQEDGVNHYARVLGICTTAYDVRAARAINIGVAVSRINGVVLQPGEQFSYNLAVLPRTSANGYVEAPIYVSGKHSTGIGGGICQVSSTLYSAMLNAGVPATERHPHSLPVPYLPEGRDATIAGNYYDLKFVNNQADPLTIWASTNGNNGTVSVMLIRQ